LETLVPFMFGVLLMCLGYLVYSLAQVFQFAKIYQFVSFAFGITGSLTLAISAALSAWNLSVNRARIRARKQKPLRETLLYGVAGPKPSQEAVWQTKSPKAISGLPHTIHMMCPSCSRPIHLDNKFCEYCGFKFERGLDIGVRLASTTPAFATFDNVSDDLQQVYRDDGALLGLAAGKADPFGDVLKIRTLSGETCECEVGRLLLIPLSSVPGQFKGSLIMMPQWFLEANEALALAQGLKTMMGGLLEDLKNSKISEKEFEDAYSTVSFRLSTESGRKKISGLESSLLEQKARLATVARSTKDQNANAVLGFELRTIDSMLNQIRSSRESLRRAVAQIEDGAFSAKTKRLVSSVPTF